jgi:cardiolipin synthase
MVVDGVWSLFGSANWDPRSLRLNFEYNLECYDRELAAQLTSLAHAKRAASREITLADVDSRPLWRRLRDGICRLALPYL